MIKPKRLQEGSKIAIISPSNGLPFLFPDIYELGLKNLREIIGLEIIEMPGARLSPDELYKNPKLRAQDINNAFEDDRIDGIITSIGGYESIRILPYLNTDRIVKNPKFIMGFSDATTFLAYLNYLGMVTFYGPSVMAGFAQLKSLPPQFIEHIKTIFFSNDYPYLYPSYTHWTNGYKDWKNLNTLGECTRVYENENGWIFLQGKKNVEGRLWGGCIEVLEFMKSTDYWPDKDFWQDKILFFEISEEKPLPDQVGYMLRNYGMQGVFHKAKGIVFGRPKDYSHKEKEELNHMIIKIVKEEFNASDIPIVVDMDFGHTDPKIILPLGCKVKLNAKAKECTLLESPFR
ncbi:LD-carboxypeptidase [Irregularibacter muris]|uniref:LD-carboxypeptidase n=1 Tax=Irregularibacter muris TaxID=1796619 RepID=A0AAE3HJB6_9FIRM|nr:S66 peptidase family protein [Irregularibacter muris]MCR1899914.1 LD-carboxypeptidase [Irregularibacter muris]